jgi:2-amino-4-hydroxy-6-hydroxymethyldihydropteridine diphosphokinase
LALQNIAAYCGLVIDYSKIYQTEAWGLEEQPSFLNQAIHLRTNLPPEVLMQKLLDIELTLGRERTIKMGPRTIDIDILLIDDVIMNTNLLTLPHPALHQRKFALTCLHNIAAQKIHPVLNKTIDSLLKDCSDTLSVKKFS